MRARISFYNHLRKTWSIDYQVTDLDDATEYAGFVMDNQSFHSKGIASFSDIAPIYTLFRGRNEGEWAVFEYEPSYDNADYIVKSQYKFDKESFNEVKS